MGMSTLLLVILLANFMKNCQLPIANCLVWYQTHEGGVLVIGQKFLVCLSQCPFNYHYFYFQVYKIFMNLTVSHVEENLAKFSF